MARIKYYYDTQTCKYERVKTSWTDILLNFFGLFVVTFLIAAGLVFLYIKLFPNKKVERLRQEVSVLEKERKTISKLMNETKGAMKVLVWKDSVTYKAITGAELSNQGKNLMSWKDYADQLKEDKNETDILDSKFQDIRSQKIRIRRQLAEYQKILKSGKKKIQRLKSIPAIQPILNPELKRLASGFGYRTHPVFKVRKFHQGVDFSAPEGTKVFATADGVVEKVGKSDANGRYIIINHGNGFKTIYSHLKKASITEGKKVTRKQVIAEVGSTGKAVSSHLGYEVMYKEKFVNPIQFFFLDVNAKKWRKLYELGSIENQTLS